MHVVVPPPRPGKTRGHRISEQLAAVAAGEIIDAATVAEILARAGGYRDALADFEDGSGRDSNGVSLR
ncbi:MAG TPA: hypothetical protein VGG64_21060 [Pirellulales bacterium]|jgi:hypothetical protein